MDLSYTREEIAFRSEVRAFLDRHLPAELSARVLGSHRLTRDDIVRWHQTLARRGWVAPLWPVDHGGAGWDVVQRHIFEEECALAGAPPIIPFGVAMVGPVIIEFGSDRQKQHYLPRILDGSDWWCQGYSEPGSGSDLASLRTRAVREGDVYRVNGQKTWTTLGQHANMMFCLVRTDTDAKPQAGISVLLIDMTSAGITLHPIITLDGAHEINDVFFDDVRVPAANLVGEENKGWTCAKYLLTYERTGHAAVGAAKQALSQLRSVASLQPNHGHRLLEEVSFRRRLAELEIELSALEVTNMRVLAAVRAGGAPTTESSLLKICGSQLRQRISDLLRQASGAYALPSDATLPTAAQYFNLRKLSIFAGSNEIQKNIVAKSLLDL